MKIKAIVTEDIPAYSLVALRGARDDDPDNIYLMKNKKDWIPDFYSTRDLKEGEEISVKIEGKPVWKVRLSKDTRPGTLISADDNGEASWTNTREHKYFIGYSLEGGKAGDVISYARKTGVLSQVLDSGIEGLTHGD